ncbi:MAG: hypothetical protein GAK45_02373 [Pseudomonas citronellolis]|nr:MAG: hypothetical protein GAK45_02373 [Pseudomonas citronellolis]
MGYALVTPAIEHRKGPRQAVGQVVGAEDRHLAGIGQLWPHQGDVHPADRQDTGTAPGRCADGAVVRVQARYRHHRVAGDEGLQVCPHPDRPHARPTTAVGDAEGLVQVHVRDVGTDIRRTRQAHLGVEVGAVHVHLPALLMDHLADFANALLVHPMGRGVGDHQARQSIPGLARLGLEIIEVDVARLVAVDDHHLHARHLRRGRVGAVGRRRNQAQGALGLMAAAVIAGDGHQSGIFTLGAGVGLHADGIETGDRAQPALQLVDHRLVALHLCSRCKGMQQGKARPGDGNHFAGGVEFHGARAQRNHRLVQRQVLVLQLLEVTQHLGFAVVQVEYRMFEQRRAAHQSVRHCRGQGLLVEGRNIQPVVDTEEDVEQFEHRRFVTGLVQAHAQMPPP